MFRALGESPLARLLILKRRGLICSIIAARSLLVGGHFDFRHVFVDIADNAISIGRFLRSRTFYGRHTGLFGFIRGSLCLCRGGRRRRFAFAGIPHDYFCRPRPVEEGTVAVVIAAEVVTGGVCRRAVGSWLPKTLSPHDNHTW